MYTTISSLLHKWYKKNSRPLPWRKNNDPYKIWISEVMLQQTTVAAVVPYYERFITSFPSVLELANAKESDVLSLWAGLGYYTRARNLHRSAKIISASGFPQAYKHLGELPGFGPYISRAVSSIAFNEPVAAIDGNLIRVLSRIFGIKESYWNASGKKLFQEIGDRLIKNGPSSELNQALMDLGADICAKKNPNCTFCPVNQHCIANKENLQNSLPKKKPQKKVEVWIWKPVISINKKQIRLIKNTSLPFLRGQWIFPGKGRKLLTKPKHFDFKHYITHHEIFVIVEQKKFFNKASDANARWVNIKELPQISPFSILKKSLEETNK